MKEHWSKSARLDSTGQLIPHSTFRFFVTGDRNQAVNEGMNRAGCSPARDDGDFQHVPDHQPRRRAKGEARWRAENVTARSGGPTVMDLKGKLGYA